MSKINHSIRVPVTVLQTVDDSVGAFTSWKHDNDHSYSDFVEKLFKQFPDAPQTILHSAVGISGEAGELLDAVKKNWAYGNEIDVENLIEELGDLRFYYQAMLNLICLTDTDIQAANFVKLRKRYENIEYSDAAAIARADKKPTWIEQ